MEETKWVEMYRKWVLARSTQEYPISENEKGNLEIECTEGIGVVNFYDENIVELRINTIPEDEVAFFLHFQLLEEDNYEHAQDLFYDMEKAMRNLKKNKTYNILLSCTSALTTSYFAEVLNEAADKIGVKYKFRAVSFDHIEEEAKNEDVILLAPQVHFERKKVQKIFPNKIIINMPGTTFAKYNAGEMIDIVKEELEEKSKQSTTKKKRMLAFFETTKKILTIGYTYDKKTVTQARIVYRYYKNGKEEYKDRIYTESVSVEDLKKIISDMLEKYPEIETIGLALPGTVEENGIVHLEGQPIDGVNVMDEIKKSSHKQVFAFNDAKMAVTGIYWLEGGYKNIICYYLPYHASKANVGIIVNGHMIRGRKSVAGELKYLQNVLNLDHASAELANTKEGNYELVSKSLVAMTATVGPQAIFVYSYKVKDMDKLKKEMSKTIDEEYIPDLISLDNLDEYLMTGTFLRCIWKISDMEKEKIGLAYNKFK